MPGYNDSYAGVVIDDQDPTARGRVLVEVAQVPAAGRAWAEAGDPSAAPPAVGDTVTVRFEGGDESYPIYTPGYVAAEGSAPAGGTFPATYAGSVVDAADPTQRGRVLVLVPEVSTETAWATPEDAGAGAPAVGAQVWVRYEDGDPAYPTWSGGAAAADTPGPGPHRAVVLSAQDPDGLGRLYVQLGGAPDGAWAEPAEPPPAAGEEVSVWFADGDPDRPVWSR